MPRKINEHSRSILANVKRKENRTQDIPSKRKPRIIITKWGPADANTK